MTPGARNTAKSPWPPPTRRAFVAMIGAAAAALAIRHRSPAGYPGADRAVLDDDPPRSTWTGTTRWIGHC
jgi:hypothetical protein